MGKHAAIPLQSEFVNNIVLPHFYLFAPLVYAAEVGVAVSLILGLLVRIGGVIASRLSGKPTPPPFRYRELGNLATIGRKEGVVDFGWLKLTGRLAWLVWGMAHIYFLIGFRNRLAVAVDWLWSYLTYQRGARLITGQDMHMGPASSKQ